MRTPVRGEATPAYSAYPYHASVAERIHATVPGARLIYLVRDPIERVLAHYVQERVDGDRRSFAERMREHDRPSNSIVCPSRYATQLERYLGLFGESQILVVDQHDLRDDRRGTLASIFAFLGVDPAFWGGAFETEHNTREEKHLLGPVSRRVLARVLDPLAGAVSPQTWRRVRPRVHRRFSSGLVERPKLDDVARELLVSHLAPEAARLRELTGKQFASWSL